MPRIIIATTAALTLILVCWIVFISNDPVPDEWVFEVTRPLINERTTVWMKSISLLGNHRWLIPANLLLLAALIYWKKYRHARELFIVNLGALLCMSLLKNSIGRTRPADALVPGVHNFSFPSGHALMAVAFYGMLLLWAWNRPGRMKGAGFAAGLLLLMLLIGFSRIYLRLHYATDVLAGYAIGVLWLHASLWAIRKKFKYNSL